MHFKDTPPFPMLVLTPASMFSTSLRLQNSKWTLSQMCICRFNVFRSQHQRKWNKFLVFTLHLNMNWHSQRRLNRNPNLKYPGAGTWRGKLWPDHERLILKVAKACWLRKAVSQCPVGHGGLFGMHAVLFVLKYSNVCLHLLSVFSSLKARVSHDNRTLFCPSCWVASFLFPSNTTVYFYVWPLKGRGWTPNLKVNH